MRTLCFALLLVATACKQKPIEISAGRCLELPAAERQDLRVSPDGSALYWLERVIARDYDADDTSYLRLVRYDLKKGELAILKERVGAIVALTDHGVLAIGRESTYDTLFLIGDGVIQTVVPHYFAVNDVEPIRGTQYAVLANADGKSSVFVLDLNHPRPEHVTDADVLFGAGPDMLFVRDDGGFAVDIASGERSSRDIPDKALPDRDGMWFVEGRQVKHRSLRTDRETRVVVGDVRQWSLLYQHTSTIARAHTDRTAYAFLLANGKATRLPRIRGGTSIVGVDGAWALIGHNTSNYDGDLWNAPHEADVCRLDRDADSMKFPGRFFPTRYAKHEHVIDDALKRFPDTTWQILELDGEPPTLYADFKKQDGGDNLDALRAMVRDVHETVTKRFGDRELRTELHFRDGRTAFYRWRRDRLRARAVAGMGDILLAENADFDLAVSEHSNQRDGDRITCRGKLTSLAPAVTLLDLQVRCIAGDRERAITIAKLEPKQTVDFAQTFEAMENDELAIEVFRDRTPLVLFDRDRDAKDRELLELFVKLHADTELALRAHRRQSQFYVQLDAPAGVKDVDAQTVRTAAERLEAARTLFEIDEKHELELELRIGNEYYTWDGTQLVAK